jgi:dTDP-4-amino-4,6-dideoxygalactose transaminase
MMIKIPAWPVSGDRELELLREVLQSPQWGGFHPLVGKFEELFARFQGSRHAITAANGTVTLEAMLAVLGIGPGDEVIVPAISFVATAMAVSRVGATPVFVDIEQDSFNIDPVRAAAAITPHTKAILAVHFGGPMADMSALGAIARQAGVLLLEDAAHAQGSSWSGRKAGSIGLIGSFSFQNGKVMTSGEGGALTTGDDDLARRLRSFINQGRCEGQNFFLHYSVASNLRITGLQAAVLVAQLERVPAQIECRRASEALLKSLVADVPGLHFQRVPEEAREHSHYLLCGWCGPEFPRTRDEFHKALAAQGIPSTAFYPHTLYQNPVYRNGGCRVNPCPNAERALRDSFWFPHRVLMGEEALTRQIAQGIRIAAGVSGVT